jgi:hypothetical protein
MRSGVRIGTIAAVLVLLAALAPVAARADEAKTPPTAALILSIMSQPVERPQVAFERSLREDGPAVAPAAAGEVQPDGSVRYGRLTITVKNPCPPGTAHYEPPPLPGRRARY